ncbi:MAG: ABC transporter permease, partial [Trueperaceae bacterium]|nr:ABC transporter permease [Trueperaceae bacterium]
MTAYIIKRVLNLIPTFLLATFLAWVVIEIAPGDFASQFAFNQVDPNQASRIREVLGLNEPWPIRYLYWLRNLVFGFDFGTSMTSKGSVTHLILPRMGNSFVLLLPATFLTFVIAIPIGVYSALHKYSLGDKLLTVFSLIGLAIPNFFLALIFLAFSVQWFQNFNYFLFPTGGMTSQAFSSLNLFQKVLDIGWHLIIPTIVVTLSSLAFTSRIMRGEMLEVLGQDYIRTAKAKGLSESTVNYKHALRNAILVIVATIGGTLPGLISGAGTIEFVMRWPGITPLFISSIFAQDVYVIMALLTILVILLMVGNLFSDIALALIDP